MKKAELSMNPDLGTSKWALILVARALAWLSPRRNSPLAPLPSQDDPQSSQAQLRRTHAFQKRLCRPQVQTTSNQGSFFSRLLYWPLSRGPWGEK